MRQSFRREFNYFCSALGELVLRIQKAAAQLFFRSGVKGVSMDDLSKKLKISKKTLYSCFQNKNELVRHTLLQHFEEIDSALKTFESLPISEVAKMRRVTQFAVEQLSKVRIPILDDLKKYYPEIHSEVLSQREKMITQHVCNNILKGRNHGYYRKDFDETVISNLFANQIIHITEQWVGEHRDKAIRAVIEFSEYHLRGISNENGLKELNTVISNENN